jgi:hypothetical protein
VRRLLLPSALALAVVGLGATGCAEQTAAARVGDDIVSESDLMDIVEARADNETYLQLTGIPADALQGDLEGTNYSQEYVGSLLQERIFVTLFDRVLDDEGVEVTDDQRAQATQAVEQRLQEALGEFPSWYQDQLVEEQSKYIALVSALGSDDAVGRAVADMAERVDIEVSSRYGSWDPALASDAWAGQALAVTPPEAPEAAPGSAEGAGAGGAGGADGGGQPAPAAG